MVDCSAWILKIGLCVLALSAGCAPANLIELPTACLVEVNRTDGAGTFQHLRGYDASGRLSWGEWQETYSGLGLETLRYDAAGRLRTVHGLHLETNQEYPGPSMEFKAEATYDAAGHLSQLVTINPYERDRLRFRKGERRTTRYRWDELGRLVETRTSDGRRSLIRYDGGARPISTVEHYRDSMGAPWTCRQSLTWDGDRLLRAVQQYYQRDRFHEERGERLDWDERGLLAAWTSWTGESGRYEYDAQGRLVRSIRMQDHHERTHAITYDAVGRIVETVDDNGSGRTEKRTYHGECAAITGAERAHDPLERTGLRPCIPTRVAGCLATDSRFGMLMPSGSGPR